MHFSHKWKLPSTITMFPYYRGNELSSVKAHRPIVLSMFEKSRQTKFPLTFGFTFLCMVKAQIWSCLFTSSFMPLLLVTNSSYCCLNLWNLLSNSANESMSKDVELKDMMTTKVSCFHSRRGTCNSGAVMSDSQLLYELHAAVVTVTQPECVDVPG